jgi:trans-aconitate 2-methyltransferase
MNDWNPEAYLKFRNQRTQPSIDLISRIDISYAPRRIIDIGCGPGNSGQALANRWPGAALIGLDSSSAMIAKAKTDFPQHQWILGDAAHFASDTTFDIVFSNATIQWIPNHPRLLRNFAALLSAGGALAFQVPLFSDMPIWNAIIEVSTKVRWNHETTSCADQFTFHNAPFYYDCLCSLFGRLEIWETTYCHIMESHSSIMAMVKSAGIKPFLDSIAGEQAKLEFENEVHDTVKGLYPVQADGKVLFPFKRLFAIGTPQFV